MAISQEDRDRDHKYYSWLQAKEDWADAQRRAIRLGRPELLPEYDYPGDLEAYEPPPLEPVENEAPVEEEPVEEEPVEEEPVEEPVVIEEPVVVEEPEAAEEAVEELVEEPAVEEPVAEEELTAKAVVDLIAAAETAEEVELLSAGDERKTVQSAAEKRLNQLA